MLEILSLISGPILIAIFAWECSRNYSTKSSQSGYLHLILDCVILATAAGSLVQAGLGIGTSIAGWKLAHYSMYTVLTSVLLYQRKLYPSVD